MGSIPHAGTVPALSLPLPQLPPQRTKPGTPYPDPFYNADDEWRSSEEVVRAGTNLVRSVALSYVTLNNGSIPKFVAEVKKKEPH